MVFLYLRSMENGCRDDIRFFFLFTQIEPPVLLIKRVNNLVFINFTFWGQY